MPEPITFFAPGRPKTKGSTRSWQHPTTGAIVTKGANKKTRAWQGVVAHAAAEAGVRRALGDDGVALELRFYFARPKGHYGSGRNAAKLKGSAPKRPLTRACGDLDKLERAVLDGLTGVAFADDSEVAEIRSSKHYLDDPQGVEGVRVVVGVAQEHGGCLHRVLEMAPGGGLVDYPCALPFGHAGDCVAK